MRSWSPQTPRFCDGASLDEPDTFSHLSRHFFLSDKSGLFSQTALLLRRLEADRHLGGRNPDLFLVLGVAADALGTALHFKSAKADQLDLVILGQGVRSLRSRNSGPLRYLSWTGQPSQRQALISSACSFVYSSSRCIWFAASAAVVAVHLSTGGSPPFKIVWPLPIGYPILQGHFIHGSVSARAACSTLAKRRINFSQAAEGGLRSTPANRGVDRRKKADRPAPLPVAVASASLSSAVSSPSCPGRRLIRQSKPAFRLFCTFSARQGRARTGHRIQGVGTGLLALLLPLEGVPVGQHLAGAGHLHISKDMGMPENSLRHTSFSTVQIEPAGILLNIRVKTTCISTSPSSSRSLRFSSSMASTAS